MQYENGVNGIWGMIVLQTLYENGVNGILADEMGLGKTVQCVAMMSHMVYMGVPGPFLVCAPLSTIPNWYNEFKRFAPQVRHQGTGVACVR